MYRKSNFCKLCNRETGALISGVQKWLFYFLLPLAIFPAVIYFLAITGKRCGLCKMTYSTAKKRDKKNK